MKADALHVQEASNGRIVSLGFPGQEMIGGRQGGQTGSRKADDGSRSGRARGG